MNASYLIAIDGSDHSLKAVEHVIGEIVNMANKPLVYLVNVQPALSSNVTRFIDLKTVEEFHREEGDAALAASRERMTQAGIVHTTHIMVGEAAPALVEFAQKKGCRMIVMGVRGLGSVTGLFMGSVTAKVVQLSSVPVLLIK
jgi:nucleotide-binding universal stress UspA family protein